MTKWAAYIDIDLDVCAWTKCLMEDGLIAPGEVMCASIKDISHEVLRPFTQVHAFCGISVWSYALRNAGWADDREVWTGSAPCQPFSVAGQQQGESDSRHLWPDFFRLINACRPAILFGEQVSGKAGYAWLDGVLADLESKNYAGWAYDISACAVDAPHIRSRLYWGAVADATKPRPLRGAHSSLHRQPEDQWGGMLQPKRLHGFDSDVAYPAEPAVGGRQLRRSSGGGGGAHRQRASGKSGGSDGSAMGHADVALLAQRQGIARHPRAERASVERTDDASFWAAHEWVTCHDGKSRRTKPGLPLLAPRAPGRVPMWRALGNAICAPLAIEVIKAFMESENDLP